MSLTWSSSSITISIHKTQAELSKKDKVHTAYAHDFVAHQTGNRIEDPTCHSAY